MSLKMITPIEINDSNMISTIPEPDASQGEVEWEDRKIPSISAVTRSTRNNGMCVTDSGVVYYVGDGVYYIDSSGVQVEVLYSGVDAFKSCVYVDGYVYTAERDGTDIIIIDTSDNSYSTLSGVKDRYAGNSAYGGDGKIYFCSTGSIISFDISSQVVEYKTMNDEEESFSPYDIKLGISGSLYMTGLNTESLQYKVISYSAIDDIATTLSHVSLAGQCLEQGVDGLIYSAGRGSIAVTNPETGSVSFFGVVGGVITSMQSSLNGDIIAVGTSSSGFAKISIVDTSSQEVLEILGVAESIARIRGSIHYEGKTFFCGDSGLTGGILDRYSTDEQSILSSTHLIYQASTNTYDNPEDGVLLTVPSWIEVSATNKYRAFDYSLSTKTEYNETVNVFEFTPEEIVTTISFFGLENITRVYVQVREDDENGSLIYNDSKLMAINSPLDDLIVNEELLNSKVIFDDLPVYSSPHISITFNKVSGSTFSVGDIVLGNARTCGVSLYQSSTSRTSYNTVEYDTFGTPTIVQRPSAEYTSFEVAVFPQYADYVERLLKDSLDQIRVWVAEKPDDEKLFTIGYYERSPITYSSPSKYDTTLKVRGLT